jgi:hypothetical protein
VSFSGERITHPILLSGKPLRVEEYAGIEDDESQVPRGLKLKWVVVVQEVRFLEPTGR